MARTPKFSNLPVTHRGTGTSAISRHGRILTGQVHDVNRLETEQVGREVGARVYYNGTTAQTIPAGAWTPFNFNAVEEDTNSMYSAGSPHALTIRTTGFYMAGGLLTFDLTGITDTLYVSVVANISGVGHYLVINTRKVTVGGAAEGFLLATGMFHAAPGDYLWVSAYHAGAGNYGFINSTATVHYQNFWAAMIN